MLLTALADAIGPDTNVSLAIVAGIITTCFTFLGGTIAIVVKVVNARNEVTSRIGHLEDSFRSLTSSMKETWSRKDQEIYSLKFRLHNPDLIIPDDLECPTDEPAHDR